MYNFLDDGALFDISQSVSTDSFDGCCYDAVDNEDLTAMKEACECDETEDDEYFIFDETLTCTRRFDRTSQCALKSDATNPIPVGTLYTHKDYCMEEIVDRSVCCNAKLSGFDGEGLDDACEDL